MGSEFTCLTLESGVNSSSSSSEVHSSVSVAIGDNKTEEDLRSRLAWIFRGSDNSLESSQIRNEMRFRIDVVL